MTPAKPRLFSGIQPSGDLHLGNYLGAIENWVSMLDDYDCIYSIVDLHAITIPFEPEDLSNRVFELAVGLMAAGLDPERCILFVQSAVPEHAELAWVFNTITPLGDLQRMTQFKDKSGRAETIPAGLLNYPVLQAADILLYHAEAVPVGEDQRQHLELTRDIARKWNNRFGNYFPEPEAVIGRGRRILGLDGAQKMSKSLNNVIGMLAGPEELWSQVRTAVTDPARVRRDDPGNPDVCNVYTLHGFFTRVDVREDINVRCRAATIGCVDCKRILSDNIAERLAPVRAYADELRSKPEQVHEILHDGAVRARKIAKETLSETYDRMGLDRSIV